MFDASAYQRQARLQTQSFGIHPWELTGDAKKQYLTAMTLALIDELTEALREMSWKPWSTKNEFDHQAYLGELVDAGHFLMNLCLVVTPDIDRVTDAYMRKADVNAKRQADGYDESNKCPGCGRALDEPT